MRYAATLFCAILSATTGFAGTGGTGASAPFPTSVPATTPAEQAQTVERFPQVQPRVERLADGGFVCLAGDHIYVSGADPYHWDEISIQVPTLKYPVFFPIGGERDRLFFRTQSDVTGGQLLIVVDHGRPARILRQMPMDTRALFASGKLGAFSDGPRAIFTTDGAKTWSHSTAGPLPSLDKPPAQQRIRAMIWTGDKKLLLGGDQGTVGLFEIANGSLKKKWIATPPGAISIDYLIPDGDFVWVGDGHTLWRCRLSDGKVDARMEMNKYELQRIVVIHSTLLMEVAGKDGGHLLLFWKPDSKKGTVVLTKQLPMPAHFLSEVPLPNDSALLFMDDGSAMTLDLNAPAKTALKPAKLTIKLLPPPPPNPNLPTKEEMDAEFKLLFKLPKEKRQGIGKEMLQLKGMTPREKCLWATERMKKILAEQNAASQPGAQTQPSTATQAKP